MQLILTINVVRVCFSNNSALTTSVVGTLKSVVQTTMGMFTFGGVAINPAMVTGVTVNLCGGIAYTYAKYLEGEMVSRRIVHLILHPYYNANISTIIHRPYAQILSIFCFLRSSYVIIYT